LKFYHAFGIELLSKQSRENTKLEEMKMADLNLVFEILAVFATLIYMALLVCENFSSEERGMEEFEYTKRSLLDQRIVVK
jgi:hypothetical protein